LSLVISRASRVLRSLGVSILDSNIEHNSASGEIPFPWFIRFPTASKSHSNCTNDSNNGRTSLALAPSTIAHVNNHVALPLVPSLITSFSSSAAASTPPSAIASVSCSACWIANRTRASFSLRLCSASLLATWTRSATARATLSDVVSAVELAQAGKDADVDPFER
jgi:hypothetical protein